MCVDLGIPFPSESQLAFLRRAFVRAKREILADIARKLIPGELRDSQKLAQFVECPGSYGGYEEVEAVGAMLFPSAAASAGTHVHFGRAWLIVRQWIHEWMASGCPGEDGFGSDVVVRAG